MLSGVCRFRGLCFSRGSALLSPGPLHFASVIWIYVAVALAGLAVLALMVLRIWRQLRELGRALSKASAALSAAGAGLERAQHDGG